MRYSFLFIGLALVLSGCQEQQAAGQGTVDWLARIIAVVGAIVAVGGLILGIRNYLWDRAKWEVLRKERQEDKEERKREKEDEKKERVTATVSFASLLNGGTRYQHDCILRIYNQSPFTISIKAVHLWFVNAEEKAKGNKSWTDIGMFPQSSSSSRKNKLSADVSADLESRKEVFFKCVDMDMKYLENIAKLTAPDEIGISIVSHAGEIERVTGDKLLDGFKNLLKPLNERKSPGIVGVVELPPKQKE